MVNSLTAALKTTQPFELSSNLRRRALELAPLIVSPNKADARRALSIIESEGAQVATNPALHGDLNRSVGIILAAHQILKISTLPVQKQALASALDRLICGICGVINYQNKNEILNYCRAAVKNVFGLDLVDRTTEDTLAIWDDFYASAKRPDAPAKVSIP